jgi:hypothetical protein
MNRSHASSNAPRRGKPLPSKTPAKPALLSRLQADSNWMLAYRVLVVAMQAATIVITWQLWQVRDNPPHLPAVGLPQFDMGPWLLGSLAVVLAAPRTGLVLHGLALVTAMLQDQLRMQPELVSMFLLMVGTLAYPSAQLIGRSHLVTIWFYAAFHKLICDRYYLHTVPVQLTWLFGESEPWPTVFDVLRGGVALFEMSLAVLAVIPRTRKWCAWLSAIFHIGVLQYLLFWIQGNEAVWPWNIALVPAGFALIRPWQTSLTFDWRRSRWLARGAVAFLFVYPAGYYVGLVDAYLAHCLYSINTPVAAIATPDGEVTQILYMDSLHVPFPPAPRLYEAYFEKVAEPGDRMLIKDYRRWAKGRRGWEEVRGVATRRITKPYSE